MTFHSHQIAIWIYKKYTKKYCFFASCMFRLWPFTKINILYLVLKLLICYRSLSLHKQRKKHNKNNNKQNDAHKITMKTESGATQYQYRNMSSQIKCDHRNK